MRVLHLLTALGPGGLEIWLLNMLKEMDRRDCAMDFCLKWPEAGNLDHVARDLGAQVHVARLRPTHVGYVKALRRVLREGRYDLVHSHEAAYSGIGVWVAKQMGVPVLCTFHHYLSRPEGKVLRLPILRELRGAYAEVSMRYAMRNATLVSTLSHRVKSELVPMGLPLERWRLLSLSAQAPAPLAPAERAALREELGVPADAPLVLHVGRFIEQKNHAAVLGVFERVHRRMPDARLVLLGQGPLRETILERIRSNGLEQVVRFAGIRNDVPRVMAASDLFLFPSRDEGFGLAALEANAAGLPVVGTRVPGLDEAVVDGETALLHDLSDVDGMADSALRLLGDRELAGKIGNAGRARAEREFSHAAAARKLRVVYDEVLSLARGGRVDRRDVQAVRDAPPSHVGAQG